MTADTDARSGDDEDAMLVDDSVPGLVLEDSEGVGVMDGANELDDEEASSSEPDSDDSNDGERDPDDPFDMAHYDDEPSAHGRHSLCRPHSNRRRGVARACKRRPRQGPVLAARRAERCVLPLFFRVTY